MNNQNLVNLVKNGFKKSFWIANIMELFERIAYYGQAAILSIFLRDHLNFDEVQAGTLTSIFGGLIYFLPIFAGALADKYGFKKAFSFAFLILGTGYFLIGSIGMEVFAPLYQNFNKFYLLSIILIFTAIGGSFIKPSVLGTVALASSETTKSIGYAIYYWLVNIGGALGPLFAFLVRDSIGIQYVFLVSSISCFLMLISTIFFYEEPRDLNKQNKISLAIQVKNLILVLSNFRFILFLLIFSLYWLMFWQIFIIVPFFISDYIDPKAPFELIISAGSWSIIAFQLILNYFTKKIKPINAIIIGFIFSTISWFIILINPSTIFVVICVVLFSIGEQIQAPRFYEYIANLAPMGQEALYQGFAFLPIAIGYFFGGTLGGLIYNTYGLKGLNQPQNIFEILIAVGFLATTSMIIYNKFINRKNN